MRKWLVLGMAAAMLAALTGCSEDCDECPVCPVDPSVASLIQTSLHYTTEGMRYWYAEAQGGAETITGIPYDDLNCKNCHVEPDECSTCHITTGDAPIASACITCHSRQAKEVQLGYSDVHTDQCFQCINCHDADEVHGDGTSYASMWEEGAIDVCCEQCHDPETLPSNNAHNTHLEDLDCAACHTQSVVTCYSCHFESEVQGIGKVPYGAFHGWKFLVKGQDGKITTGNMQTLTYEGQAFTGIGPYYAHTIYKPDPAAVCDECHDSAIVQEYNTKGSMTAVWWDAGSSTLQHYSGTIPVPEDWETSLGLSFVTKDAGGNWIHQSDAADAAHMLFCEPLDNMPPQF